jgi:hypothetical protein
VGLYLCYYFFKKIAEVCQVCREPQPGECQQNGTAQVMGFTGFLGIKGSKREMFLWNILFCLGFRNHHSKRLLVTLMRIQIPPFTTMRIRILVSK